MALVQLAARLLYPDRCPGCGRFGAWLCTDCRGSLPRAAGPGRCPHCRARWAGESNCPRCFTWDALDGTIVACDMAGVARRIVHALKYQSAIVFARVMADLIDEAADGWAPDAAIAVPLHWTRERRRGFNQAGAVLEALGWPGAGLSLRRVRRTDTQVGRREQERRRNMAGAFSCEGAPLDGQEVAIVDDVITTGATVTECARLLRERGARRVVAVAFARAHFEPGTRAAIMD